MKLFFTTEAQRAQSLFFQKSGDTDFWKPIGLRHLWTLYSRSDRLVFLWRYPAKEKIKFSVSLW